MSEAPIWPVSTGDLIADTTHLDEAEFGAYVRLMLAQWRNGGRPLPNEPERLCRFSGVTPGRFKKIWPVIEQFFDVTDAGISQPRIAKDFEKVSEKIKIAREKGKRGGRPKLPREDGPEKPNPLKNNDGAKATASDQLKPGESQTQTPAKAQRKQPINHKPLTIPPNGGEEEGGGKTSSPGTNGLDPPGFLDRRQATFVEVGKKVCDIARIDHARFMGTFNAVQVWLAAGHTEETIYAAVREVTAGANYQPPTSLNYFTKAVERHAQKPQQGVLNTRGWVDLDWKRTIEHWIETGEWPSYCGPEPDQSGCLAPAHLIPESTGAEQAG